MPVKTTARESSILPFFPLGFPDETIGSRVSRYHIRRGRPTIQVTYKQLFDKAPFSLTGLVQPNLDKLAERLPGLPRHNLVQLQNDSTLLPLFQQFFGPKSATRHPDRIPGPPLIKLPRRIKGDNRLTYICTHCLVDDERDHGCPYIHRAHQIPGVTACWKHSVRLLDRCPSCGCPFAEPKQLILSAWMGCECGCALADQARPDLQPASAVEVEFARFAQVLLAAKPSKLSIEQLIDIYKVRAIEIGCQWGDKRVNHSMLLGKIEAHFGAELFAKIDPAYKSGKTEHWLNILCAHSAVEAPLTRHLVAAYFLFRDATLFLSRAEAILYAKPELGDPPHILGAAPRSSNGNVESIREKRPEEELLDELVNLAQRDHYDIAQLWRHHFSSMKRVVKLLPNASEVIERRLASAAAKQKKDAARALKVREQHLVRDAQWSEAIKASAVELYGENARPVRVTKNRLLQASKSKSKSSWPAGPGFPLTAAAISGNEESLWHFYARRILWTLQCLHDPHTTEHKIIALSKLEVNKFRVIMEYFSDFVPCGGGSIQVIKSILKSRGLAKNWQGPCPEREFYKAGRAYRLRTARRGPIGGRAGDTQLGT
ncbi:TniQ family protein [Janthinobacterium sp. MDT1-19]|uniref:TniQ family protein n=1 Tax=Janthinobacterium sp. MDT1-19 TaxID=1259339 RepID=UPI003F22872F